MKSKKTISILVLCIVALSIIASSYGAFSSQGPGEHEFTSLQGLTVSIYGKGLYKNDSVDMAVQARAQDVITLVLGVPLLLVSLYLFRKDSLKGRLLLAGTLGYFLYTYVDYTFYAMYNSFFLLFVALMSLSFFAFILTMMSFNLKALSAAFTQKLPVKFIAGVLLFLGAVVGLMWLARIVPPIFQGKPNLGLQHYTTLVVQALDLGILLPTSVIASVLLIKRNPFGYLLSTILIVKMITLLSALTAMIIGQAIAGIHMSVVEMSIFPLFNLITIVSIVLILKNINENGYNDVSAPIVG
ncbi:hypothetical protein [Bacillus sp. 1NLA3E]|uniref:hypothetical protein n=1 Tax=Bacillus sp. 1NLA3E TaxID=666686 RepID=UPI000247EF76|nr:hypothetical protein [Bacillus sp. 1NLA3E]AGK54241.1 hypothetical protein B1NLA3E_12465 [Bacillus sp. 1NLA3E]